MKPTPAIYAQIALIIAGALSDEAHPIDSDNIPITTDKAARLILQVAERDQLDEIDVMALAEVMGEVLYQNAPDHVIDEAVLFAKRVWFGRTHRPMVDKNTAEHASKPKQGFDAKPGPEVKVPGVLDFIKAYAKELESPKGEPAGKQA